MTNTLTSHFLKRIAPQIFDCQKKIGDYQKKKFRSLPPGSGNEKISKEFVSKVDLESEKNLKENLEKLMPSVGFYGEETGYSGSREVFWIVDPLDGTTNFLSGLDQWGISIALYEKTRPILGSVYKPSNGEHFLAIENLGVWHNGEKVIQSPPSTTMQAHQALIGTGFPYRSVDMRNSFFQCANEALEHFRGIRRFGSAALDLAYTGLRFMQGFWETDLEPYDVAASLVILKEMNCLTTNFLGEPYHLFKDRTLVVGDQEVHSALQKLCEKHYKEHQKHFFRRAE